MGPGVVPASLADVDTCCIKTRGLRVVLRSHLAHVAASDHRTPVAGKACAAQVDLQSVAKDQLNLYQKPLSLPLLSCESHDVALVVSSKQQTRTMPLVATEPGTVAGRPRHPSHASELASDDSDGEQAGGRVMTCRWLKLQEGLRLRGRFLRAPTRLEKMLLLFFMFAPRCQILLELFTRLGLVWLALCCHVCCSRRGVGGEQRCAALCCSQCGSQSQSEHLRPSSLLSRDLGARTVLDDQSLKVWEPPPPYTLFSLNPRNLKSFLKHRSAFALQAFCASQKLSGVIFGRQSPGSKLERGTALDLTSSCRTDTLATHRGSCRTGI